MSNQIERPVERPALVVVGAGQIGTPLVKRLARVGHAVTWVSRRTPAQVPEGVRHVSLDASDGDALAELCSGAAAVVAAANPAVYDANVWARTLLPLHRGLLRAAERSGARLVLLDNLYVYATEQGPLSLATPQTPSTRKGAVRKQIADMVAEAQRTKGVRAVTLRASDFWGPGLTGALVTEAGLRGLEGGKGPLLLGDPDAVHAFSHRDDVVDGLMTLALAADEVEGQIFHAPVIHVTPRELVAALADAFGVKVRPRRVPRWLLRCVAPFSRTTRGLIEMLPQWENAYLVDDSSYTERFGRSAIGLTEGAARLAAAA